MRSPFLAQFQILPFQGGAGFRGTKGYRRTERSEAGVKQVVEKWADIGARASRKRGACICSPGNKGMMEMAEPGGRRRRADTSGISDAIWTWTVCVGRGPEREPRYPTPDTETRVFVSVSSPRSRSLPRSVPLRSFVHSLFLRCARSHARSFARSLARSLTSRLPVLGKGILFPFFRRDLRR